MLTGITNISDIKAFGYRDGVKSPCDGELSYRGYNIKDLVTGSGRIHEIIDSRNI